MSTMTRAEAAAVLGVSETATADEIATAWRTTAKTAHPDMGGDPAQFARVSIAAELMSTAPDEHAAAAALSVPRVEAHVAMRINVRRAVIGLSAALVVIAVVIIGAAPVSAVVVPIMLTTVASTCHVLWTACGRPHARSLVGQAKTKTAARSASVDFAHRDRKR